MTRRAFRKAIGAVATVGSARANLYASAPPPPGSDELCDLSAVELTARTKKRDVSARDVMTASRAYRASEPKVAIVTLVAERALADAARADEMQARGATLRAAARASRCSQGSRRHGRDPDYPRLTLLS